MGSFWSPLGFRLESVAKYSPLGNLSGSLFQIICWRGAPKVCAFFFLLFRDFVCFECVFCVFELCVFFFRLGVPGVPWRLQTDPQTEKKHFKHISNTQNTHLKRTKKTCLAFGRPQSPSSRVRPDSLRGSVRTQGPKEKRTPNAIPNTLQTDQSKLT